MEKIKHPILELTVQFSAGGLMYNVFETAMALSKEFNTTVKFKLENILYQVTPDTTITQLMQRRHKIK